MAYWWQSSSEERYWCEITDREDIGADLKCPQADEQGQAYWSYGLIKEVWPGDIVFHYSTRQKAFVGASVAGAPLEEREIVWVPHGTVGRSKDAERRPRPGWWLPLYRYTTSEHPLKLVALQEPGEHRESRTGFAVGSHEGRRPGVWPLHSSCIQEGSEQLRGI